MFNILKYGKIVYSLEDGVQYMSFSTESEAGQWGYSNYADWSDRYKEIMRIVAEIEGRTAGYPFSTIECYCGYAYRHINSYLRGAGDALSIEVYKEMSHILTILISDAPRIADNIIVYRLVCDDFVDYLYRQSKIGAATIEKGFMSTSLLATIADQDEPYAHHKNLLKIYVPHGTPAIYVNTVARRSEQEILFAPNRYLAMVKHPYKGCDGKIVIECKMLNMEGALLQRLK